MSVTLPIYLCDDQPDHVRLLASCIQTVIQNNGFDMKIAYSSSAPVDLMSHLRANEPTRTGIYFLDVDLETPLYNGFTLGLAIRALDPKGYLIYVTAHSELAIETFRYRLGATDYIVKEEPALLMPKVHQCLASIQAQEQIADSSADPVFTLKVFDEIIKLPIREILYFETSPSNHKVVVCTTKRILEFYGKLQDVMESLPPNFMRTHRSYVVNLAYAQVLHQKEGELELKNGARCLVSRTMKKELEQYLLHSQ